MYTYINVFARVDHYVSFLQNLSLSRTLNWTLISPLSPPIFFFGKIYVAFMLRDSSILGEYVTLSVKLYILALCTTQCVYSKKLTVQTHHGNTLYFGRGQIHQVFWTRADPTNMDFSLPQVPSSSDSFTHSLTHSPRTQFEKKL